MRMLPQLDISHYASQIFWLFVLLTGLIWFIRSKIIPRVNNILAQRQRVDDELRNERNTLEKNKKELTQKEGSIRKQFEIECKDARDKIQQEFLKNLDEELYKIRKKNAEERKKIKSEYIDYYRNGCWKGETDDIQRYARKKLKHIGSL